LAVSAWYGTIGIGTAWVIDSCSIVDGISQGTDEFNTGYSVGTALGYMINNLRCEEILYMASDMDTSDSDSTYAEMNALTILGNAYLYFITDGPLTPVGSVPQKRRLEGLFLQTRMMQCLPIKSELA
jgi:hypothetical protein